MRALLVLPIAIIALFATFSAFQAVTGDPSSAVTMGLLLVTSASAWLSGRPEPRT